MIPTALPLSSYQEVAHLKTATSCLSMRMPSSSSQTSARPVYRDLCVRCRKNNTAPYAALSNQSSMLIKSTQTAFFIFWTLES